MSDVHNVNKANNYKKFGRRSFLKKASVVVIAAGAGGVLVACNSAEPTIGSPSAPATTSGITPAVSSSSPIAASTTSVPVGNTPVVAPTTAPPLVATATLQPVVSPNETGSAFLKAWQEKRYADMYGLLSNFAKSAITQEKFVGRYEAITQEATLVAVTPALLPTLNAPAAGAATFDVPFQVTFKTVRVGEFSQQNKLPLQLENGRWLVNWTPGVIFTQLEGSRLVRFFPDSGERGLILDAKNIPLANFGTSYEVFVVPGKIDNEELLLTTLSQVLGLDRTKIKALYQSGQPDWRMPIKDISGTTPQATLDKLLAVKGVGLNEKKVRTYPQGKTAAHIVGYISTVTADDLKDLAAKGYREDDVIGRTGVEAWGEEKLAGGRGGRLTVIEPEGKIAAVIKQQDSTAPSSLLLTLDLDIQRMLEKVLGEVMGSIVVINAQDGAVLGMASFPRYDPNQFITGFTAQEFKALNDDPRRPFQHRAANGLLPVGSTFKVITMAAALERAGLSPETMFNCTGHWTGLGEQFSKDCYLKTGHGNISLYNGLVASCDFVFYELGKKLDEIDPLLIPAVAKGFGFGSSTGITGLYDSPGQIPDPAWKQANLKQGWVRGDAVNLAIGQGYMLATPLQLAAAYAAIGNGGNVPSLRLVAKSDGGAPQTFEPKVKQRIPISPTNLARMQQALKDVTGGGAGIGTARNAFAGSKVKVAGKTGTAESGKEEPHAWFVCYAPADKPRYAITVVLENGGFGSDKAAPLARQVIDQLPF